MNCTNFGIKSIAALAASSCYCGLASGQSFNLDFDNPFAPPEGGGGVPSSSFGAAANQPGFWNATSGGAPDFFLRDLSGTTTSVSFASPNGGSGTGFNNPNLSGDFRLLMSDGRDGGDDTWTFSGLANGQYQLYSFAVSPSGTINTTTVTVLGATIPIQTVTGRCLSTNSYSE